MAGQRKLDVPTAVCCTCQVAKPVDSFHRAKDRPNGRYPQCRECKAHRERVARAGRTPEQVERDREAARKKYLANRDRQLQRQKARYHADPTRHSRSRKNRYLISTYGITLAQYEEMLTAQDGVCAVCRRPEWNIDPRRGKTLDLAVDHDHATGAVRALLCRSCNVALGLLNDDTERLLALIRYLDAHRA